MKKIGNIFWRLGIVLLIGSIIIRQESTQSMLNIIDSKEYVNLLGYRFILISSILMIIGFGFLALDWMRTEEVEEPKQELTEEERIRKENIDLIGAIKSNIPFTAFYAFMSTLSFLGVVSIINLDEETLKELFIHFLILIPFGLLAFYYLRKLKRQFVAIKEIKAEIKMSSGIEGFNKGESFTEET